FARSSSYSMSALNYVFLSMASPTPSIYTLSLHDALPISAVGSSRMSSRTSFDSAFAISMSCCLPTPSWLIGVTGFSCRPTCSSRSEEHTSELQSRFDLVCRLLLVKKKKKCILYCEHIHN